MPAKTYLWIHLVFTTKYRRPTLDPLTRVRVLSMFQAVATFHHVQLLASETGTDGSHVHLLVCLPPSVSMAAFVRDAKSASSRRAGPHFTWGRRYFAKSVGCGGLSAAQKYVKEQWRK
jgi:putative transposase